MYNVIISIEVYIHIFYIAVRVRSYDYDEDKIRLNLKSYIHRETVVSNPPPDEEDGDEI